MRLIEMQDARGGVTDYQKQTHRQLPNIGT